MMSKDYLGRLVRKAIVESFPSDEPESVMKNSGLLEWEDLSEETKNAYRLVGDAVLNQFAERNKQCVIYQRDGVWVNLMFVEDVDSLLEIVKKTSGKMRYVSSAPTYDNLKGKISALVDFYEREQLRVLSKLKHFKDDVVIYLRAVGIVLASVSDASTHAEKNARLRGAISQLESAIHAVRKEEDHYIDDFWQAPDIFRSDYPVRKYVEKIKELEYRLSQMEKTSPQFVDDGDGF